MKSLQRLVACSMCFLLSALPVLSDPQSNGQPAGKIDAMIPATTLNTQEAEVKEDLHWNDLLATEHTGRVRADLTDGSMISLGSDSQLRVVQHDGASQQTSLEMSFGKVRSQVVKITKPGGKFQMTTPNAVIGVIGTDFYVEYVPNLNRTTVICYEGQVFVNPLGNAQVTQNTGQANATNSITVSAGQMVVVTTVVPPGGFQVAQAPTRLVNSSIQDTAVIETAGGPPVLAHASHPWLYPVITIGLSFGAGLGVALGTRGNYKKPASTTGPGPTCPPGYPIC